MNHSSTATGRLAGVALRLPSQPAVRTTDDAVRHGQRWRRWRPTISLTRLQRQGLEWQRENAEHFERSLDSMRRFESNPGPMGTLWGAVLRPSGEVLDLGLMSCRVVTDTGTAYLIDSLQGLVEPELLRYHGIGTSTTAESAAQTALVTELTTQYNPSNTRATGSQGEQSGDSKTYETIGTNTVSATVAITEHGLFSQAAVGGGTMLDRSVFSVVNLVSPESFATTYRYTLPSGG
jgi:hypothetical protein